MTDDICWNFYDIILDIVRDSTAKKINPKRFCDTGLFKIVRCPNYLGEILFWTGVFVSGLTTLNGIWQWGAAIAGWVCIVYIMFGGARRLEIRQNKNYGHDPEYQEYVKKTPIILPLVPLYSVEKYTFLKGWWSRKNFNRYLKLSDVGFFRKSPCQWEKSLL